MRPGGRRLLWVSAVAAGIVIGVCGYLLAPLPVGGTRPTTPPTTSAPGASSGGSSTSATEETGPPFTRSALLQPEEFVGFGWGRGERTAITDGIDPSAPALCGAPGLIGKGSAEAYTSEYEGLQTHAVEIVTRYASEQAAEQRFDQLAELTEDCAEASPPRRATPTTRHRPRLPAVEQTSWWELRVPAGTGHRDRRSHAVLAVARIDDRLVYLLLSSATSDPVGTVQFEPLLTQAARRLV